MSDTQTKLAIRTSSKPLTTQYDVMFDREIDHANEWHEELYTLRGANEGDVCNIHINTCGGAVSTISAFQHIKNNSQAHFHGILEGIGYSAGSAFFLMCDTHEVGDFAEMMIHTSQGSGFYTHSQGREDYGKQGARTARKLVETVYKDFLSDEEIEDLLIGKEFWFDSDEIKERLQKRDEIRMKRQQEEDKRNISADQIVEEYLAQLNEDCEYFDIDLSTIITIMCEKVGVDVHDTSENEYEFPSEEMAQLLEENVSRAKEFIHFEGGYIPYISIYKDGTIIDEEGSFKSFADLDDADFEYFAEAAKMLGVKHARNISEEKLARRLDEKVAEIVREMNK